MPDNSVSNGKAVFIVYSVTDKQGRVLDQNDIPTGYVHGSKSELLPQLEQALEGARVGDAIDVEIPASESDWQYDESLTFTDDIDNVPEQFRYVGAQVEMQNEAGEIKSFHVSSIEDGRLTVDGNHPFAGKDIIFHVQVKSVRDATNEEMQTGRPVDENPVGMLH